MLSINRLGIGMVLGSMAFPALAGDITMRGFASIVGGQSIQNNETIYDYGGDFDFRNDSLAALQFGSNLGDGLSATVQVVARGAQDFTANVEWAYLTYEFTDSVQLSAGRIRVPFYRYSDFIDVRYTYSWVKVPDTVYGFNFPGYDGLSLLVNNSLGRWDSTLQVIWGQLDGDLPSSDGLRIQSENIAGFGWTMNRDWLTFRLGYMSSKTTLELAQINGIAQLVEGVGAATSVDTSELASNIRLDGDFGDFFNFAVGIDYSDWLINAEYISYGVENNLTAGSDAYYLMLGKRLKEFTPYITYSNSNGEVSDDALNAIPASLENVPIPQLGGATLPQFIGGVMAASEVDTDLIMAGLRYDFHPSAALKVEYLREKDIEGEILELFRVGVDLVF